MGQRSRKRSRSGPGPAKTRRAVAVSEPAAPEPELSRTEAKNAAARAALVPLAPGERPGAVTVAVFVAVFLAVANLIAFAAGVDVKGQKNSTSGVILFAVLMFSAAWGMWKLRYWAVLGFEALLALTVLIAGLSLTVASNVAAVALSGGICVLGGWLFFKLVKAMARIQLPEGPRSRT